MQVSLLSDSTPSSQMADDSDYGERSPKRQKFESDQDKSNRLVPDETRAYLVSEKQLRKLFSRCLQCGGQDLDGDPAIYEMGVDIRVELHCRHCSTQKWHSFEPSGDSKLHEGNGRMAAATIISGNTFEDINSIAKNINLQMFSSSTFHRFAAKYVYPIIDSAYIEQHEKIMSNIRAEQAKEGTILKLAMDGRFSRPGYTATFGVVSALDLDSKLILDACVLKKNEDDITSSQQMEVVGTKRLLDAFSRPSLSNDQEMQPSTSVSAPPAVRIGAVTTDDSTSVMKMMAKDFSAIHHGGDPWHLLKSIRMRLEAIARRAACRELGYWIKCIDNFIWTSMKECKGDEELLVEQFR